MIKKLSMTLLLIGALVMTAGFSSNSTLYAKQHVQSNNFQYVSTEKFSESTIQELIEKCFGNADVEVEKQPEQNENQKEVEQPEKEQTPAEEKPEKEQPENNNENEAPVEVPVEEEETQQETPAKEDNAQENTEEQEQTTENNQNADISEFEQEVVALTNEERQKQGLPALEIDAELSKVAKQKSEDMATNGYFSHNSPTYGSPFDMIQQAGIDYRTAGENIAKGQQTPEEVVNAWMNSEGHRANILNENFTHIGVGHVEQGNHWTQQFIGK